MVPGRRRATQCIAPASSRHESLAEAHRPRSKTDPGHRPRAPASRRVGRPLSHLHAPLRCRHAHRSLPRRAVGSRLLCRRAAGCSPKQGGNHGRRDVPLGSAEHVAAWGIAGKFAPKGLSCASRGGIGGIRGIGMNRARVRLWGVRQRRPGVRASSPSLSRRRAAWTPGDRKPAV